VFVFKKIVMKNLVIICYPLMVLFSTYSWGQNNAIDLNSKSRNTIQTNSLNITDKNFKPNRKVKYYLVEETTSMTFGGHKRVYVVSNPKHIPAYDLGINSKRIITPVFVETNENENTTLKSDTILRKVETTKFIITDVPKKQDTYASIDIMKTYERVSEQGYESLEMLKKLANSYFFSDDFEKAEKSYRKLFTKTTDLEPEYYYRYSIALKSVGEIEKSKEYLKKFNELSSKN
jgi:tetratricopeptide (TPR) repeat protein